MQKLKIAAMALGFILLTPLLNSCRSDLSEQSPESSTAPTDIVTAEYATPNTKITSSEDGSTEIVYALSDPAGGELSGKTKQTLDKDEYSSEITVTPATGYVFKGWSDGVTSATRSGDEGKRGKITTLYAIVAPEYLEMPVLHITTETEEDVTSKTDYIGGTVSITNCEARYAMKNAAIEIRGRGNNSWTYDKKSYRFRFDEKENPLGIGKEAHKSWNLIANHCDHTLLRNYTALKFAAQMSNIAYSPACINVEVYLNGSYNGVYLLCEPIQVNDGRVEISENTESGTDIGYLLQITHYAEEPYFEMNGRDYEIKSDLSADRTLAEEQAQYIEHYLERCYDAIEIGNRAMIGALIDLDSAVDAYIVEEVIKNLDVGWDSFYFYKDAGGKLSFGPIWDFDLSMGNANEGCEFYTDLYVAENLKDQSNPWLYTLMSYDWFRAMVKERYTSDEVQAIIASLPALIEDTSEEYRGSFCRNFERWEIFGQRMNRETRALINLKNYDEHVQYLVNWMNSRITWMNGFIDSELYDQGFNREET